MLTREMVRDSPRRIRPIVRNIAPIDPLDDLPPPLPLRPSRSCDVENCREIARPGGRRCRVHHLLDVRRWRSKNHTIIKARRRDVAADRDADARAADSARAKVAMAIKRGTITRGPCCECGSAKTTAYVADPAKWREIAWVCRDHRDELIRGILEREQAREKQDAWKTKREWALSVFEVMPPEVQAEIRTLALRNPIFQDRDLEIGSPLYLSKLVSEVEKRAVYTSAADRALTTNEESDRHRSAVTSEGSAVPTIR
jgi:hypothetical protein